MLRASPRRTMLGTCILVIFGYFLLVIFGYLRMGN